MKNKIISILVAINLLCLAGCASNADDIYSKNMAATPKPSVSAESAESEDANTLSGAWTLVCPQYSAVHYEQFSGLFAEEIPGVTVETVTYPENGYREKVQLALVGGEEIDLLDTQLLSVRDLANSGLVRDLGVFYDNNAQEDYVNMVDTYRVDGKLYEMPVTVLPMAVWTDKKMTESLGVELPETLSFSTLNDWTQQAEKGSEYYMIKEYPKASAVMNELSAFLDFDEKTARFDTPECVQLLENMYDFAFAPDSDYTTSGSDNFSDYFAVYNSVPSPSLAFPVGYPKETVNDPKPFALENGDVLLEKFCTLAIPTESKNAENAWTYIDFVTGDLTEYIDNVTAWSYSINRAYDRNLTVLMLQRQFNFTEEEAESALENFDAIMEKYNAIPTIDDRLYASLYETVNAYLTADKAPAEETAAKLQASAEQYFAE